MNSLGTDQSINIAEYYGILLRHKFTIILSAFIAFLIALIYNATLVPVYNATSTLIIDKDVTNLTIPGNSYYYESYISQSLTFNTHFELITSRPVLELVVKDLKLDKGINEAKKKLNRQPNPIKKFFSQFRMNMFFHLDKKPPKPSPEDMMNHLILSLKSMITIEPVPNTRLLNITVTNSDPVRARDIANSLARSYIKFDTNSRMKSSQNTINWLSDHLFEVTQKLEDAEEKFLDYKQQFNLISLEDSQKLTSDKITELSNNFIDTRNKRLELDAKLKQLEEMSKSGKTIPQLSSLVANELINSLNSQLVEAEVEYSRLRKKYQPKHPKVIEAATNVANIRNKLQAELKKEVENLKAERELLQSKEDVLQKAMDDFGKEGFEASKKELKYTMLKRNVEINQNIYNSLLTRLKEADITENLNTANIRITSEAMLPKSPIGVDKNRNLLMGIIIGLMIGFGLSFLYEYLDRSLRTEEKVKEYLDLPVLAVIPMADVSKEKPDKADTAKKNEVSP